MAETAGDRNIHSPLKDINKQKKKKKERTNLLCVDFVFSIPELEYKNNACSKSFSISKDV